MKKINTRIIFIVLLVLIGLPFVYSIACEDLTKETDVPCTVVTPYITGQCNSPLQYNYSVVDINTTLPVQNGTMSPVGDGTYNFTLNNTGITLHHSYSVTLCSNNTATITIIEDTDLIDSKKWMYIIVICFSFLLYFIGRYAQDYIFPLLAGMLLSIFSIYVLIQGLIDLSSPFIDKGFFLVTIGLGFYFLLRSAYEIIQEGR